MELLYTFATLLLVTWGLVWSGKRKKQNLTMQAKRNWVISHIFFYLLYFGGLLTTLLLTIASTYTMDQETVHAAHLYAKYSDWFLIIPGALGCFVTGVWLSVRTHWGLVKYYWVIVKLVGNLATILFGAHFMRIWYGETMKLSSTGQLDFFHNSVYLASRQSLLWGTLGAFSVLIFLVIISKVKPWGKRNTFKDSGKRIPKEAL